MSLPAPFGKYELIEQIGTGGMADVFLARSFGVAGFEKRVVLKRIKPEHARDPRFVSLFIHEAKIGVHLSHPNIVAVYELGKVGESWYIAMEHLHGRDLNKVARTLRAQERTLDPQLAVRVVAEALRGLAFAHGASSDDDRMALVHRDVSPHNIFLTFTGDVKIVDFGIARLLDGDAPATPGVLSDDAAPARPAGGKYAYMSPEQALGQVVDHRTDIFSAGIVLWELIVGERLYEGTDPEDKLRRVQQAVIPHPRDRGAAIDDDLWAILSKALSRDVRDRYASAAQFEEDLRAWAYREQVRPPGRTVLAAAMHELFPDVGQHNPAALDLRRLADDLRRLDEEDVSHATTGPDQGSGTPGTSTSPPKVRASGDERKRVAVLVIDVDGFTGISMQAEPEALFKRHLQMLRWLRRVVDDHGGTVQHVHDDQAYVFFGIPLTRNDDLHRALDCATELHRRLPELREQGIRLELAVGVHVGDVTLGHAGSRIRYTARGDTTRFARRLSEQADHGQVLVSDTVMRAAGGPFAFQRGPWLLGRGGRPPLASYQLTGRQAGSVATERGPWLKRSHELDTIRAALVAMGQGHGAAVVLHGADGFGKSRLVQEIWETARKRRIPTYLGHATPFGHPLGACRGILLTVLGLTPQTPDDEIRTNIERFRQLGLFPRDLEAIETLLGVRGGQVDTSEMWHALRRVLAALAHTEPIVVILEDVHHIPAREVDHLAEMMGRLTDSPVLWLLTLAGPVPASLHSATPVELGPLSAANQARLLATALHTTEVHPDLVALAQRTCEGNPLYLQELANYLRERDLIRVEGHTVRLQGQMEPELPATLAGILGARIDALDPASKGALQLAAVIGPSFSVSLLGEVIGLDDPVPIVNDLAGHGLIRRTDVGDTWAFASDFVRQAALHGILGVQKRDYHRWIAAALERRVGEGGDEWAEVLSEHCGLGGRQLDGARYAHASGKRHEKAQEFEAARRCYARGLQWIRDAEQTPDTYDARVQGEALLEQRLGTVCLLLGDTRRGVRSLQASLDLAEDHALPWLEVRSHLELGRHYLSQGVLARARAHFGQAHTLARLENDRTVEVEVLEARAQLAHASGTPDQAVDLWQEALARAVDDKQRAACLLGLASVHTRTDGFEAAGTLLQQALELAQGDDDRILEGRILNQLGLLHMWCDEPDDAVQTFRRALQVREDVGFQQGVVVDHHHIGDVHFMRGDHTRAYVSYQRSRDLAEEMGWQRGVALNDVYLGYLHGLREDARQGAERIEAATEMARRLGDGEVVVSGQWLRGRLLTQRGRVEEGTALVEAALQEARTRRFDPLVHAITRSLQAPPSPPTPSP